MTFSEYTASGSTQAELERQLNKFNEASQVEEAQTQSFLAKVNARITSQLPEMPDNSDDGRFILLKNSSYYFPVMEDEG